ncbi:SUMF1/EgtB/PvdO family nonheme iron enzyme [Prosthecobacter sp.]|uniref:SUMF1/EgtB/PvdO family nonheme iron enzyme n=1 Tax=Prosthecobacter sp. TaxID=1965333 RepID=UPI0037844758
MARPVLAFWKNPPAGWLEAVGEHRHEVLNRHAKTIVDAVCRALDERRGIDDSDWDQLTVGVDGHVHVSPDWGSGRAAGTAAIKTSLNSVLKELLSPEDFNGSRGPEDWHEFFASRTRKRHFSIPRITDAGFEKEEPPPPDTRKVREVPPAVSFRRESLREAPEIVQPVARQQIIPDTRTPKPEKLPPPPRPRRKAKMPFWAKCAVFVILAVAGTASWYFLAVPKREIVAQPKQQAEDQAAAEIARLAREKAEAWRAEKQAAAQAKEKAEAEEKQKQMAAKAQAERVAKEKAEAEQKQMAAKAEAARLAKEKAEAEEKARAMAAEAERKRLAALEEERKRKAATPEGMLGAASKAAPFTNTLGMKFVPAGTPGLLFSVWETRVQDFSAFVSATSHDAVSEGSFGKAAYTLERTADGSSSESVQRGGSWKDPHFPDKQSGDHPVVCVSYLDAEAFCAWLTKKEREAGKIPAASSYRLPTDEEWSSACGSGRYPWGGDYPPASAAGNYSGKEAMVGVLQGGANPLAEVGFSDTAARTAPVGQFAENGYGLKDMGGNVFEWCSTWYESRLNDADLLTDFPGLKNDGGGHAYRVLRGASWSSKSEPGLRTSCRNRGAPHMRNDFFGFRCVLTVPPAAPAPPVMPASGAVKPAGPAAGFENSLGMKFVPVPITKEKTVLFSVWDVRVKDYRTYATDQGVGMVAPSFAQTAEHPVVNVTWEEARAFCQWLSKKEGKSYRLPTDVEWSCAAGLTQESGDTPRERAENAAGAFPWGNEWPPPAGAGNYDVSLRVDDSPHTSPVGAFPANALGLSDMGGNVWQWCEDWDEPGIKTDHVLRGGSWGDSAKGNLLSSCRGVRPAHRDECIGFRVVLDAAP